MVERESNQWRNRIDMIVENGKWKIWFLARFWFMAGSGSRQKDAARKLQRIVYKWWPCYRAMLGIFLDSLEKSSTEKVWTPFQVSRMCNLCKRKMSPPTERKFSKKNTRCLLHSSITARISLKIC